MLIWAPCGTKILKLYIATRITVYILLTNPSIGEKKCLYKELFGGPNWIKFCFEADCKIGIRALEFPAMFIHPSLQI
jgi:hypothetical protein